MPLKPHRRVPKTKIAFIGEIPLVKRKVLLKGLPIGKEIKHMDGDYILDLTRMVMDLGDEDMTENNLMACIYGLSIMRGTSPGRLLVDMSENVPGHDDWFEDFMPTIMDYESHSGLNEELGGV